MAASPSSDGVERRRAMRTGFIAVLLGIAVVLAPIAVVATSLGATVADGDRFVATFGGVIDDADLQSAISDAAGDGIVEPIRSLDPAAVLEEYVRETGAPTAVSSAVALLATHALQGIESTVRERIEAVVASEPLARAWESALHVVHRTLLAPATTVEPDTLLRLDDDGTVWLQLAPVAGLVRAELEERAPLVGALLPARVVHDVRLVQEPALAHVRAVAQQLPLLLAAPWICFVVFAASGILLARTRRRVAALAAGACAVALIVVAGVISWWPEGEGAAAAIVAAFAAPVRVQASQALLIAAAVFAVAAVGCALWPRVGTFVLRRWRPTDAAAA